MAGVEPVGSHRRPPMSTLDPFLPSTNDSFRHHPAAAHSELAELTRPQIPRGKRECVSPLQALPAQPKCRNRRGCPLPQLVVGWATLDCQLSCVSAISRRLVLPRKWNTLRSLSIHPSRC